LEHVAVICSCAKHHNNRAGVIRVSAFLVVPHVCAHLPSK